MKIAILLPAYKRPEYTKICLEALERAQEYKDTVFYLLDDGSCDCTSEILLNSLLVKEVNIYENNVGLRDAIIDFFDQIKDKDFDFVAKMDNDCCVPSNWLNDMLKTFNQTDADILSPNVMPSNAAFFYGEDDIDKKGYRPSEIVGGLWMMRTSVLKDIEFSKYDTYGLTGAISILKQIVTEKDLNVGWVPEVVVQDIGHWSGEHQDHIKSREHLEYSLEVGRQIAWTL